MQEVSLKKGVIKVTWEGNEYLLKKPTVGKALELEKSVQGSDGKGISELSGVLDFIVDSGLPREVLMELDVEGLEVLIQALMPPKKK